jgi:1,4-dihydroxy-2-naphthoate octaprenyltransferase
MMIAVTPPPSLGLWLAAMRPRTLSLSVVPVAVGAALVASGGGVHPWPLAAIALFAAFCIQVGTNLHNDAADGARGADGPDRLGPPRVTALGLVSASAMRRAALLAFALAGLAGVSLVWAGGWPILCLGLLSLAAGWSYSGGPKPISYSPLGEVFVIVFFGLSGVMGTVWLLVGGVDWASFTGGLAVGLFAAAVLLVNNHRDEVTDRRAGRRTLAILIGPQRAHWLYAFLMLAPFALLPVLAAVLRHGAVWPAFIALPAALWMAWRFPQSHGRALNAILGRTAQVQLLYGALLCLGLLIGDAI